ncbi:class I SAM-dependent methyltransferase [Desulfurivibrio sp. D14AmB]|uniref:class I SAM-dependent methyltransferase n=1 Tax=Desulfurivibrio sp. D14AmB TaxID=3374370 RepID=UPI00376EEA3E
MDNPDDKKKFVKSKFAAISSRYDLLNSVLSFQVDRYWRWVVARELRAFPRGPVLDLCAGTLPLALELARQAPERVVLAADFCEDMLRAGLAAMGRDRRRQRILPVAGDGEQLPVISDSVWGVTVAFGVRNLARTQQGLAEMHRVLKPGGKLLILEFSRPQNPVVKPLYNFYLNRVLPKIAGLVSGDQDAYEYLASSIAAFYEPDQLAAMMGEAGFATVSYRPLTFGIVTVYVGVKGEGGG